MENKYELDNTTFSNQSSERLYRNLVKISILGITKYIIINPGKDVTDKLKTRYLIILVSVDEHVILLVLFDWLVLVLRLLKEQEWFLKFFLEI